MIGRIVRAVDFEKVLRRAPSFRSPHFALHHLAAAPEPSPWRLRQASRSKLSTAPEPVEAAPVDDHGGRCWLGAVVPKRHAKRSVTRSLLKRQIRAVAAQEAPLAPGLWVVRLRAPFVTDPVTGAPLVSAASGPLRAAASAELRTLFAGAARKLQP